MTVAAITTLLCTLLACAPRDIPTSAPQPQLTVWLAINGKSMLPTYPDGTLVEIRFPVDYDSLELNDIVVFWDYEKGDSEFTIHRLVGKRGDQWLSRGDNKQTNKPYDQSFVTRDNVYAVATGRFASVLIAPPSD